jgi:hypothetical protein
MPLGEYQYIKQTNFIFKLKENYDMVFSISFMA